MKRTADWPVNLDKATMAELEKIRDQVRTYEAQVVDALSRRYEHESPLDLLLRSIERVFRWGELGHVVPLRSGTLGQVNYVDYGVVFALSVHNTSSTMLLWVRVGGRDGLEASSLVPGEATERSVGHTALDLLRRVYAHARESPPLPNVVEKTKAFLALAKEEPVPGGA